MKNKRLAIIGAAVPLLAVLGFLGVRWVTPSLQTPPTTDTPENTPQAQSYSSATRAKHQAKPSADAQRSHVPWAELKDDDPWIAFYNDSVERVIEGFEKAAAKDGLSISPEDRERLQAQLLTSIDAKRTAGNEIPELSELLGFDINNIPTRTEYSSSRGKLHEGPQTVEAIMESFEVMDRSSPPSPGDDEVDLRYPRDDWIRRMLDHGVVFEDYGDYSGYLGIRHTLMLYEDKPNDDTVMSLKQEYYGLAADAPWEEVAQAIIDKSHQNLQAMKQAELEDPLVGGGFGTRHGFIPARENTLYVKVDEKNFSANFYGDLDNISDADEEALVFDGIAPQGLDIVYLDEFDKPLPPDAKPRLDWSKYDWETIVRNLSDDDWAQMTDILNEIYDPDEQKHHGFEAPATDIVPGDYSVNSQIPSPDRDMPLLTSPPAKKLRGFETPTMKRRIAEVFEKHETNGTELPPALQSVKSEYEARKRRRQRPNQMETKNSKIETDPAQAPPVDDK